MISLSVYGPLAEALFLNDVFLEQAIAENIFIPSNALVFDTAYTEGWSM